MDECHLIIEHIDKSNLVYEKDKEKQMVNEMPEDSRIVLTKTYNNYIVFMEKDIEKHDDDLCIKCDDAPYGIDLVDNKLIFSTKISHCYSLITKKLYDIKEAKQGLKANDRYIYYADNDKLYYMNIDDLK